jgi:hypothetical protein
MNSAYGHYGQYGQLANYGAYGKTSNQARCAAAKNAKRSGKKSYRLRNVDSQIGKFCKEAEGEVEALETAKEAAGLGKGHKKQQRRAERAAMGGPDPVLIFGGLAFMGLLMAGVIVMRKGQQQ